MTWRADDAPGTVHFQLSPVRYRENHQPCMKILTEDFTMGSLFRRTVRRAVPKSATLTQKNGQTFARWKSRGKTHTAPVEEADGKRCVVIETGTYYARFKDHT